MSRTRYPVHRHQHHRRRLGQGLAAPRGAAAWTQIDPSQLDALAKLLAESWPPAIRNTAYAAVRPSVDWSGVVRGAIRDGMRIQ